MDQSHVPEGDVKNLRMWQAAQKQGATNAMPHKARRRFPPKVAKCHETCDPGRSLQVELSYLGKLLNTPDVISWPPGKPEGHSWYVVIRLGYKYPLPPNIVRGWTPWELLSSYDYTIYFIVSFVVLNFRPSFFVWRSSSRSQHFWIYGSHITQ